MTRILVVLVSPQGETTVQAQGFSGADCLSASKWLEQALGLSGNDRKTAEFYAAATQSQQQETHQ